MKLLRTSNHPTQINTSLLMAHKAVLLCAVLVLSFLSLSVSAASPETTSTCRFPVDTTTYRPYPYIRFVGENDSIKLTDEEFYDLAAKITFPINKYTLPKRDSIVMQLQREVFPLINQDSLEMVHMILRGATSPEGPTRFNRYLGEKRAETLLNFIKENLTIPMNDNFEMDFDVEDYRTLCIMMHRRGDPDYGYVQAMCDQYLSKNQPAKLKTTLRNARQGRLWIRLFREYFPQLRAARMVFFFRKPLTYAKKVVPEVNLDEILPDTLTTPDVVLDTISVVIDTTPIVKDTIPAVTTIPVVVPPLQPFMTDSLQPRRELLSVKTNLLFYGVYMPGYNRWCPIPNVAVEYYPKKGHFTFGASFDMPWWQDYDDHKYFQLRNYQLETRYYLRSGDIENNKPGEGAAFRGLYLQAYGHVGLFGICFDADRGWVGEGAGAGLGLGYVLPISKSGHWRLEFGAQFGYFRAKYDPYQYENPVDPTYSDNLYYYKWTLEPELFKKRQYRFNWFGPPRIGATLSYDLLYRRNHKSGMSFKDYETYETQETQELQNEERRDADEE